MTLLNRLTLLLLAFLFCQNLVAQQDSILVSKNFQFKDGIYLQFEELQQNVPSLLWSDVKASLFTNPQTFLTKVESIIHQSDTLQLDSIWAVVLGGIPYIKTMESTDYKASKLAIFAGLQVRGKICYYTFEQYEQETKPISAFNPLTGRAFRTANITQDILVKKERIFDFETGESADFSKENLLRWIANDAALAQSVKELSDQEVTEKLFKCLLIYDDRHPIYLR